MTTVDRIVELIRKTSSSLPDDVLKALKAAKRREEKSSSAVVILDQILKNCALASKKGVPLCQDTGTLAFYVDDSLRRKVTPIVIKRAVAEATKLGYLRKNCIDSVTGMSYDDNVAEGAPVVHYGAFVKNGVSLLMKGGGSENMSRQYSLPDEGVGAGRDLEGVKKCVLDAIKQAKGYGCAPGVIGVCIGGDRATAYEVAKEQLLREIGNRADGEIGRLEGRILKEANGLGIGPMGLGGRTTVLDVKIAARPRVPASFFVTVAYMCWALRRGTIRFNG